MAIEILSIPAMSDDPERVFLGGYCIVLWDRMQIDPKTLKKTKYLKNWH
jgi:hAT family C-terminal dimerisation region